MRNSNKSLKVHYSALVREIEKWSGMRIRDLITTKSQPVLLIRRPNHNTKFQWNRLITFAVIRHTDRHHIVFEINVRIYFVSLVNPVSIHLLIHLSTHPCHHFHSQHPSLLHFFTPGSKPILFQQILPTFNFLLYLLNCLHDNGTGPDLSCSSVYF